MTQNYSLNDFILYAFNETTIAQTVVVQKAIDSDILAQELYDELTSALATIDRYIAEPGDEVVDNIMKYACTVAGN